MITGHISYKRLPIKGGFFGAVALATFGAIEGIFLGNLLFNLPLYPITFYTVLFAIFGSFLLVLVQQLCCRIDESGNILVR